MGDAVAKIDRGPLERVVNNYRDSKPQYPKENPAMVKSKCVPDEKSVAEIDSVRIGRYAMTQKFQREYGDFLEARQSDSEQEA